MTNIVDELARVPYLRCLSIAEREDISRLCEVRRVADGAHVFREGDAPVGVFLILSGRVRLVRASAEGREQVLHEEGEGATLGEVPVFDGGGYVASAVASGDASLLFIPRPALLDALSRNPAAAAAVIQVLAARVRKFAGLVEDLSLRSVRERLAGYLLRRASADGGDIVELPLTRDQLASHVGTVREQVSRALADLRRRRLIAVDGRRIRIINAGALRRLSGSN